VALEGLSPRGNGVSLSRSARWQAALRSLFLQGAWNFDRLQNLGWAFCVEPALRELYPDPALRAQALKRHLELFNTHPYMAGYILGAALRAETEAAEGRAPLERVAAIKTRLSPALAAVGDSFFWATLRPASAMLGVVWLWLAPRPYNVAAPFVFLAFYNLPGLWLRLHSLAVGWAKGEEVALHVAGLGLPAATEGLRMAALVLVGALAGSLGRVLHPASGSHVPLAGDFFFLFPGAGLAMLLLLRLAVRPVVLLVLCTLGALVLAMAIPK
jgi:mannose PTS system EIID component